MDRHGEPGGGNAGVERRPALKSIGMIGAVVGGIVGGLVGSGVVRRMNNPSIDAQITEIANEVNKTVPLVVDQFTRLDSTAPLLGRKMLYKYTLMNLDPLPTGEDLVTTLRPGVLNNYKTSADMAELRKMDVTLVYSYYDEEGHEVGRFEVSPGDF